VSAGDGRPPGFRGAWRLDAVARGAYAEAAGIARVMPRAVAVPLDADDVQALVRWAHGVGAPLVPRGAGSSMAGGAIGDGIVVDLSRLDAIGPVDVAQRRVRVAPGAARAAVDGAARAAGLRFPPDPSSGAYCTVGGMAGTNAAGAHTLRFGAMRSWVLALECVFDDGTRALVRRGTAPPAEVPAVARFLREAHSRLHAPSDEPLAPPGVRKDSSGYAIVEYARSGELVDLLVGSEGTLALFTALELALVPAPGATSSLLAAFATLEQAVAAAAAARDAGASACELLDRTFLDVAREGGHAGDVPADSDAVLLAEVEADDAPAAAEAARVVEHAFRAHGATTVQAAFDEQAEHALWELRHAASPILARLAPSLASMQFIEDGAVPPDRLPAYVRGVRDALARRGMRGVIFGHAGDAHVHVNPLVDMARAGWRDDVESLLDEVTDLAARLGGTLAGEHGDGRLRTPLLARMRGAEARARYALVKRAFDPAGILNPGVKVPLAGQRAIGDVKYDPALAPLPEASRRVLARVAAERAYGRSRLEMLEEGQG
jgi:FAD/FMN-containing dehydrogenase